MDESDSDSEANQFNRIFIYISQGMNNVFKIIGHALCYSKIAVIIGKINCRKVYL